MSFSESFSNLLTLVLWLNGGIDNNFSVFIDLFQSCYLKDRSWIILFFRVYVWIYSICDRSEQKQPCGCMKSTAEVCTVSSQQLPPSAHFRRRLHAPTCLLLLGAVTFVFTSPVHTERNKEWAGGSQDVRHNLLQHQLPPGAAGDPQWRELQVEKQGYHVG